MSTVISIHTLHDANVSICKDGKLLAVLELERLFDVRYFCSNPKRSIFEEQWRQAIGVITSFSKVEQFGVAVTSWVMPSQVEVLKTLVNAERWVTVDHHVAHAALGFYDSPFQRALVMSYDGGGNDGTFNVYSADRTSGIKHLEWVGLNLGTPYRQLATAMPEVTRDKFDPESVGVYMRFAPLALSGKVMGYAALGKARSDWLEPMREYYTKFITPLTSLYTLGEKTGLCLESNALGNEEARDLAATSQYVFSELLLEQIEKRREWMEQENVDGIVLTGGCALNVHANQLVTEKYGYPVHIPAAPNDCGISVGAAWVISPPNEPAHTQYAGLPCWDSNNLNNLVNTREAKQSNIKELAQLLLDGAIIGVVRGRQEFGPRALGHRSMLCYPNCAELKEKLNKLKGREWFRPLCPSIAIESVPKLFHSRLKEDSGKGEQPMPCDKCCIAVTSGDKRGWVPASPYMSFAPYLTEEAVEKFPAIAHFDGTARLQTVRAEDDVWYHSLLTEVASSGDGFGILLNTSFNVKGKPILNRLSTALEILDTSPDGTFDYVLLEDWLFTPQRQTTQTQ